MTQIQKIILGIGGAHIDRRGQVAGSFVPGASNPGSMGEDVGGGIFNALRNAKRCGVEVWLLSVRGGDAAGEAVARAVSDAGIRDLSVTFLDRRTPSYTAIIDRDGDIIAALADMALYDLALGKQLRRSSVRVAADQADALFCDANLATDALARVPTLADGKPIFAIGISPAKAVRLTGILPHLACLFLNTREAGAIVGLPATTPAPDLVAALQAKGLRCGVLSHAAEPILAFDPDSLLTIDPPAPRRIVDVTGAGDALAGMTAASLIRGAPFAQAVRAGMAAALLAIESADPAPPYTAESFAEALALVPEARTVHQAARLYGETHAD